MSTPYRTPATRDEKAPLPKRAEPSVRHHLVEATLAILLIELVLRGCH